MEWITDNWKFIAIGVAVVIVLALIAYFYTQNSGFFVKQGFQNAGDGKHEFIMFHATWCGHCKNAMPDFDKFRESGVVVAGQPVKISKYDSDEAETKKMIKDLEAKGVEVKGFPTFVLITADGKVVEHKGERSIEAYTKFLNDTLGGKI